MYEASGLIDANGLNRLPKHTILFSLHSPCRKIRHLYHPTRSVTCQGTNCGYNVGKANSDRKLVGLFVFFSPNICKKKELATVCVCAHRNGLLVSGLSLAYQGLRLAGEVTGRRPRGMAVAISPHSGVCR